MASEPQPLDTIPLIRRKRGGEGSPPEPSVQSDEPLQRPAAPAEPAVAPSDAALRMKPRETVQLAAVHVRIPEQLARGLRLMSVPRGAAGSGNRGRDAGRASGEVESALAQFCTAEGRVD